VAEELDGKPHHHQEEGDGEEHGQGRNVILLGRRWDAALAQAQSFGDEALLHRAGRGDARGKRRLVALVGTETGSVC
jgi:hypothetical protein